MSYKNDEVWEHRGERGYTFFTNHPFVSVIGGILALVVVVGLLGLAIGWFNAGKDIVSPTNVKAQYHAVIEDYQSLEAAAANACAAKNSASEDSDPTLIEKPDFAYAAQYRRISVDYNRRQANIFEAEKVGPKGYPRVAPQLKEMQRKVC